MSASQRYALEPLAARLGVSFELDERGHCRGATALADLLGVPVDSIRNWRKRGIPASVDADAMATALGMWAGSIWWNWGSDAESEEAEPGYFDDDPSLDDLAEQAQHEQSNARPRARTSRRTAA